MGVINSLERVTTNANKTQVKVVNPIVSVAVPATSGATTGRPIALNISSKAIGNELHKDNLVSLDTIYFEERKHLGETING